MSEIVVLIPVLERPGNAPRVIASLTASGADARPLFLVSPHDRNQARACHATGADAIVVPFPREGGDWARKINHGLTETDEPWLLLGADDLEFHTGWDQQALKAGAATGCGVIGTNDLGNPYVKRGHLATHALVSRQYAVEHGTIDEPGKILHEGYHHNWVDAELTETAKARNQFAFAPRAIVEHLHPHWGKSEMDDTYKLGLDQKLFDADRRLLQQRRRLWAPGTRWQQRRRQVRR